MRRRTLLLLYSCRCYAALELLKALEKCTAAFCYLDTILLTLGRLLGFSSFLLFSHSCYHVPSFGICNLTSCGGLRCRLLRLGLSQGLDRSYHLVLLLGHPGLEAALHLQELI